VKDVLVHSILIFVLLSFFYKPCPLPSSLGTLLLLAWHLGLDKFFIVGATPVPSYNNQKCL
jgi:hypothetical protein